MSFDSVSSKKGFTLVEVLITMAILVTGIVFVFRAFFTSMISAKFSQDITMACFLAENKIWEIEENRKGNITMETFGSQTLQNKEYKWNYLISKIEDMELEEMEFDLSWQEKPREKEYLLKLITYLPPEL
ncbi:MAG: prepilin-type N-terminal cleavage/methylation domain-containing protein [Candidatus Omnitrophota bacterium]